MFQLKGCRLDACAPSSFLAGSARSASALKQDATRGVASRSNPRLSPVFEWIRVRVAPYAQYVKGGNGFARPAGRPECRRPDLLTALASLAWKVRSSAGRARCSHFRGGGGVGGRASLMGEGRRNAACRGRTFRGRRPPGLRASARPRAPKPGLFARAAGIAAQARPSSVGKARLKIYYPPVCVRLMYRCPHACPRPAPACIVLPRAAPQ